MLRGFILFFLFSGVIISGKAQQTDKFLKNLHSQLQKSNKDSSRVNLLLQLSEYYFSKSPRQAADLDSSLLYVQSAETLSKSLGYQKGEGNSYEQISKIFHIQNDTAKGKYYAHRAIEIFKANNFFMELGFAYFDLSGYYSLYSNELSERIRIVEQLCLPAFQQARSKIKEADIFKELGDLRQIKGDYSKSLSDLRKALQIYQSIGYPKLHGTYDLMGHVSRLIGNDENALKYGLLAIQSAELVKDTSLQLATIYNRVGSTYTRMKKYQLAHQYLQKSLSIAKKYNDTETIIIVATNISRLLVESNKLHESLVLLQEISQQYPIKDIYLRLYITSRFLLTYTALKQFKEAQKYCDELLKISEKLDQNDVDQASVHYPVTEFYLATHQYALAHKNLVKTEIFFKAVQSPLQLSKNHLLWFKLDSTEGNYLSAISHYQQYKALADSSLNETTSKHIEQLQIEFDAEKKDQDIKLLEKESKLQQGKLAQANQTRKWTLGVATLLLIISGLLITNSRLKHRTNKKLRIQQIEIEKKNNSLQHLVQEKEWLVKEIHHRVKNNFHIVMGLLGTQSGYLKSEEAITAMSESQHRVHAMSLIHQKLYQSDNLSAINMAGYIHELVDYLRDSFNIRQSIQFNLQIDPIELGLSHCIPVGLIINEAITNSIKYAFPDNRNGVIEISFKESSTRHILLAIHDTGVGLPPGFYAKNINDSMGMRLMQGLSDDIDGKFSMRNNNGAEIILDFVYDPDITISITQVNTEVTNSV